MELSRAHIEALERHSKIVLQFSGGKDSLACLFLLEPYWKKIVVFHVNTGAAFPETRATIEWVRGMVPWFFEVKSDVLENIGENGFPVDVLPFTNEKFGKMSLEREKPLMQSVLTCCGTNIWIPLHRASLQYGATLIIRGQRQADILKAPIKSGEVREGIEFLFPLESWSTADVRQYLGDKLPAYYEHVESSLDCWVCTAYLFEDLGRWSYMRERHPVKLSIVRDRIELLKKAVSEELEYINVAHEATRPANDVDIQETDL